jgi:hypothetical protein
MTIWKNNPPSLQRRNHDLKSSARSLGEYSSMPFPCYDGKNTIIISSYPVKVNPASQLTPARIPPDVIFSGIIEISNHTNHIKSGYILI